MKGPAHDRAKRRSPSSVAVPGARGHAASCGEEFLSKVEGTSSQSTSAHRLQSLVDDDVARRCWAAWSRWQHGTPGEAAAACPRYQHARGGCSQRSVCRQPVSRVSARTCTCAPTVRCAPTAQLWNRWPHVRSMWPVPFPVARRPSLYREQSADDRDTSKSVRSRYRARLAATLPPGPGRSAGRPSMRVLGTSAPSNPYRLSRKPARSGGKAMYTVLTVLAVG